MADKSYDDKVLEAMIATVRDERGVTHVAIRVSQEDEPFDACVIGALCEDTLNNLLSGTFVSWTADEIGEGLPDCMSCLVQEGRLGALRSVT